MKRCLPFRHSWGRYGVEEPVGTYDEGFIIAQKRTCTRCGALDYRRVRHHD